MEVWNSPDEINFEKLPERFVLKCTHDSGAVYICDDRNTFDIDITKRKLALRVKQEYYQIGREWPYRDVPKRIIAEEYIDGIVDNNYKFFCFNGECKALYVALYREKYVDYFDRDFNHLDIYTEIHGPAPECPAKPALFERMRDIAETVAEGIREVRVDLYISGDKIYFGECTFLHEAGFMPFQPEHWNKEFGSWLKID